MYGLVRTLVAALGVASLVAASDAKTKHAKHGRRKAKTSSSHAAATGDVAILQNLLAIEQASSSFYKRAYGYFVAEDWTDLGVLKTIMDRQASWANEDASHVASLSKAVSAAGGNPASPCSYSFNYVHAPQFLAISRSLDGVAVSAYIGAVGALGSADARTLAASILANKARRQALSTEMFGFSSIPTATDPALDLAQASSALSAYISSCPSGVAKFGSLSVTSDPTKLGPGKSIAVKGKLGAFLHVVSSSGDTAVPLSSSGSATLPGGIAGRVYLFTSDSKTLTDDNTNAGPAVVDLPDSKPTRLFALGHQNVSWKSES